MGLLAPCPTPILEDQGVPLSLDSTLWRSIWKGTQVYWEGLPIADDSCMGGNIICITDTKCLSSSSCKAIFYTMSCSRSVCLIKHATFLITFTVFLPSTWNFPKWSCFLPRFYIFCHHLFNNCDRTSWLILIMKPVWFSRFFYCSLSATFNLSSSLRMKNKIEIIRNVWVVMAAACQSGWIFTIQCVDVWNPQFFSTSTFHL
jgi:hypothetical protein